MTYTQSVSIAFPVGGTGPPSPVCVARNTAYPVTLPRSSSTENDFIS